MNCWIFRQMCVLVLRYACDITFPHGSSQMKIIPIKKWFTNTFAQKVEWKHRCHWPVVVFGITENALIFVISIQMAHGVKFPESEHRVQYPPSYTGKWVVTQVYRSNLVDQAGKSICYTTACAIVIIYALCCTTVSPTQVQ